MTCQHTGCNAPEGECSGACLTRRTDIFTHPEVTTPVDVGRVEYRWKWTPTGMQLSSDGDWVTHPSVTCAAPKPPAAPKVTEREAWGHAVRGVILQNEKWFFLKPDANEEADFFRQNRYEGRRTYEVVTLFTSPPSHEILEAQAEALDAAVAVCKKTADAAVSDGEYRCDCEDAISQLAAQYRAQIGEE